MTVASALVCLLLAVALLQWQVIWNTQWEALSYGKILAIEFPEGLGMGIKPRNLQVKTYT